MRKCYPPCVPDCKQSFQDKLASSNKNQPLRPCSYCSGISQDMLHSHYGGSLEEFCKPHCMSQFTILYYRVRPGVSPPLCTQQSHSRPWNASFLNNLSSSSLQMGRCDCCRKQGSMSETLQCSGNVRNFCSQPCLLQYCSLNFERPHTASNGTGVAPQTPYGK